MSIEEVLALASENHWAVEFTLDGELVIFTGLIDETKIKEIPEEEEPWDDDLLGDDNYMDDGEDGDWAGDPAHDEFLE